MDRGAILETARKATMGDRNKTHGDPHDQHAYAADLMNAYLGIRLSVPLSAKDIALMLVLLKISRSKFNDKEPDHYVDMCGYAAIAGQIATSGEDPASVPFKAFTTQVEFDAARENARASESILTEGPGYFVVTQPGADAAPADSVMVKDFAVSKGMQVKLFATDEIWDVEEVLLSDSGLHMVRVRHYPSNREHEMLAKHIHSVVGA